MKRLMHGGSSGGNRGWTSAEGAVLSSRSARFGDGDEEGTGKTQEPAITTCPELYHLSEDGKATMEKWGFKGNVGLYNLDPTLSAEHRAGYTASL